MGGFSNALLDRIAGPGQAPVAQINPLDQQEKQQAIAESRQAQQLNAQKVQEQQMLLDDQKTLRSLQPQFVQRDKSGRPTGYDFDGLIAASQGRLMPQTIFALQKQQSDLRQSMATATKDELANQKEINGELYQRAEGLKGITDPQLRQKSYESLLTYAQQHRVDVSQWPAAAPSNDEITAHEAGFGMHAEALKDQETQAETEQAQAKTGEAKAATQAAKFKEVNGTLFDVSGAEPKVVTPQGMQPDRWLTLVDQIVPDSDANHALNLRTKSAVQFYIGNGNQKAAQDEITKAGQQLGAIEKDVAENTNPQIQASKLRLATATKAMEQAIADGDPKAAAKLLVDGTVAPSQLISSRKPAFAQQAFTEAAQMQPGWTATKADADYKVASSPTNVAFFGSAKSLTEKGGTLDQLADAGKDIPGGKIPVFNSIADAMKASTGSGPIAKYASILLGVADDYSKVMGGGQGSDTSRTQALSLVPAKASPEARKAALEGIRGAVNSQIKSRIGKNAVLEKMYGDDLPAGAASAAASGPPSGATHTAMGSDGKKHYTNAQGQDLGIVQ